jgi:hypothetical protein
MLKVQTITDEPARGCGLRKEGGLYLIADGFGVPCGKLPLPLDLCPTCGAGIKFSRGWTWLDPRPVVAAVECKASDVSCGLCSLGNPPERVGLLWIGAEFYKTVDDYEKEVREQGISRRISAVPREFVVGETWVWLAHMKAITAKCPDPRKECKKCDDNGNTGSPAIFRTFLPRRIEYVVNGKETDAELESMQKRGISLVKLVRTAKVGGKK